ncbi:nucleotidyltransferase domain-containing protein [Phytomonospora sp. NPDC050363]|uniref:nucleotidyltransferase domain-containing protein n=1 Tax=Phytomonospora sp. NPDC050363 TaxID=3155642 RepID=UPI00340DB71F
MTLTVPDWAGETVAEVPCPVVFATVSGAHLYGFPSADSDVDLRGVHLLGLRQVVGLRTGPQTLTRGGIRDGVELDVVTHDLAKFARLMLKPNGYVLEQLTSPLVIATGETHEELKALAPDCVTRGHERHYEGFARGQWELFGRTGELKPLLYAFRVLLTGVHLMRTGEIEANLTRLEGGPGYLGELIEAKRSAEHGGLGEIVSREKVEADVAALRVALVEAAAGSRLRGELAEATVAAMDDLVVRRRLEPPADA